MVKKSNETLLAEKLTTFLQLFQQKVLRQNLNINLSFFILAILLKENSLPISEIGKRLNILKPNMTSLLDNLEKENKIKRCYNKNDRRIINIEITKTGKGYFEKQRFKMRENIISYIMNIPNEDKIELNNSLEKIISILQKT